MIINERFVTYLNSLDSGNTRLLEEIEQEALRTDVPIIRRETQNCLKLLLALKKPKHILEVGTAIGFSAIFMKTYNPAECRITTIENYEKRIPIARANFLRAGMEKDIQLIEGDAAEALKSLSGPYDMIFMDAAKGQYIYFLPQVLRLLAEKYHVKKVILFGSRARGDYKRTSDIDLAVLDGDFARFSLDVDEETSTLLEYDIVDLNSSVQEALLQSIREEGKVLYEEI